MWGFIKITKHSKTAMDTRFIQNKSPYFEEINLFKKPLMYFVFQEFDYQERARVDKKGKNVLH